MLKQKLIDNINKQIKKHLLADNIWTNDWWKQWGVIADTAYRLQGE